MSETPFDKDVDETIGGIERRVTSTSWNKTEYRRLKKLQSEAPVGYLKRNLSSFIKFMVLER